MRRGRVPGTLLGPEETGSARVFSTGCGRLPRMRDGGCGAVRFLRTAQWTRASIYLELPFPSGVGVPLRIAVAVVCGQVFKGTRWMPWYQEPMKDAGACDNPRGAGSQAVIRGFPNGETRRPLWAVAPA